MHSFLALNVLWVTASVALDLTIYRDQGSSDVDIRITDIRFSEIDAMVKPCRQVRTQLIETDEDLRRFSINSQLRDRTGNVSKSLYLA
jgi:hypothetical protein